MSVSPITTPSKAKLSRKGSKAIPRRDIHFKLDDVDLKTWNPHGQHVSQFMNALSIVFPEGEKFFIESARHFKDQLKNPQLLEDLQGFIGQEAMHGREHRVYNERLAAMGYDVAGLERDSMKMLRGAAGKNPLNKLAATCALEHFTAVLADVLLNHPELIPENAHPEMRAMWMWHAVEENEHKAVCYDVYQSVTQGPSAYVRRTGMMALVTVLFWSRVFQNQAHLVRRDGIATDWRGWLQFGKFAFTQPGGLRHALKPYLDYFKPGFHPWQHDNRALLEQWKARYDQREMDELALAA
ncbi:MAG: metal-dependent hydrolase [Stagnimonas sp.]|nr:metal-dependent hydrolase [Stagnimonas sp.]